MLEMIETLPPHLVHIRDAFFDWENRGYPNAWESIYSLFAWQLITPDNLPKAGDEIGCYRINLFGERTRYWASQGYVSFDGFQTFEEITHWLWSHFRSIAPPEVVEK